MKYKSKKRIFWTIQGLSFILAVTYFSNKDQAAATSPAATALSAGVKAVKFTDNHLSNQTLPIADILNLQKILPEPKVETDVVNILADFPVNDRPYIQVLLHTLKDIQFLNKHCTKKATSTYALSNAVVDGMIDLIVLPNYEPNFLMHFALLKSYLSLACQRLDSVQVPPRFEQAHQNLLAYLFIVQKSLSQQQTANAVKNNPVHLSNEAKQYRTMAYRLYKVNGLDLAAYFIP